MVAINNRSEFRVPSGETLTTRHSPLRGFVDRVVRYERAPYLADSLQLSDELAAAAGCAAPLDEDPPEPSPEMQERLDRAILAARRSIDRQRAIHRGGLAEINNFRVDQQATYRARQLLSQGKTDAEIRRLTGLGRKALLTIKRGETPRSLSSQSAPLERCPDCGGLVAADAPCLLCAVRAGK